MATNILMPALSPTMTEGTLARWLKNEGEPVKAGDIIAEIETDKATMEVEAVDEGVLGKILVPGGTANVKVNDVIAVLVEPGESADAAPAPKPAPAAGPAPASATPKTDAPPAPAPAPMANGHAGAGAERVFASPLARRMASQAGIDLGRVKGSGPNGRIVKSDIEAAMAGGTQPAAPEAAPAAAPAQQPAATAPAPKAPAPAAPMANGHATAERIFASPLARRMASQAGIDLGRVKGTGPNARIVKSDIEAAMAGGTQQAAPKAAPAAAPAQQPAAPA
ncbi:MAG TPA: E3 binding domain-containing protein, partial [Acetobacteraceae bacterium]|nr:E3 binding domain-containing protein [Acetobacteraceae bacterium]